MSEIKEKLITTLRWVGAVILPPIGCCVAGFILKVSATTAYRYLDIDPQSPGILNIPFVLVECVGEGVALALTSYFVAPKHKFYTCSIVTTIYATFYLLFIGYWIFHCHPGWVDMLKQFSILGGMVGGIVYVKAEFDNKAKC